MIRKLTNRWSLVTKFLSIVIIIVVVPIIVLGFTSYSRSRRLLETQMNELITQIADEINNHIDSIISDYDYLLVRMLAKPEVLDFVQMEAENYLGRMEFVEWFEHNIATDFFLKNLFAMDIEILGENGITYSSGGNNVRESYGFYNDKLPTDGALSTFHIQQNGEDVIALCRRIFSGNKSIGIMVLNIKTREVHRIWDKVDLRGGEILIFDYGDNLIYQSDENLTEEMVHHLVELEACTDRNSFEAAINSNSYFCVMRQSSITGWKMLICMEKNVTMIPINSFRQFLFSSIFVLVIFSVFTGYFFIRSILHPLKQFGKNMKQLGGGNWKHFSNIETEDEIGQLMREYNRMVDEIEHLVLQIHEHEKKLYMDYILRQRAELQALQSQINPHFLYNTLGTINAYAMADSKENIQIIVDSLSKMFRYATRSTMQAVKVKDEIEHVRDYLCIQSLRLSLMPEVVWEVDDYLEWPMLRLTLQPLVENAFKHGFRNGVERDSRLTIQAYLEGDYFIVAVWDNGTGPEKGMANRWIHDDENNGDSVGLANVIRRIKIIYGDEFGVRADGVPGEGARFCLVMPKSRTGPEEPTE